jgi:hypothetical protein
VKEHLPFGVCETEKNRANAVMLCRVLQRCQSAKPAHSAPHLPPLERPSRPGPTASVLGNRHTRGERRGRT